MWKLILVYFVDFARALNLHTWNEYDVNLDLECDYNWMSVQRYINENHRLVTSIIGAEEDRRSVIRNAVVLEPHLPDTECFLGRLTMDIWLTMEEGGEWWNVAASCCRLSG